MAIFGNLHLEDTLQESEKTRINCDKSFVSSDEAAITLVRIKPEVTGSFVTVTTNKYLDWAFTSAGTKTVTLEITTDGAAEEFTDTIVVVTSAVDNLFSNDSMLVDHEPDIMSYIPEGKNSFLNIHRLAQKRILDWLDEKRIWDSSGNRLTSVDLDSGDMESWSKYLTLQYIMSGLSNQIDDIFAEKSGLYRAHANTAANRAVLRIDVDGDGSTDDYINSFSGLLVKR